jgi:hypothetical protein
LKNINIYNKELNSEKPSFKMESTYNDFDEESKKVIKELAEEGEKFNTLINKLQIARDIIDKGELKRTLSEEIKK